MVKRPSLGEHFSHVTTSSFPLSSPPAHCCLVYQTNSMSLLDNIGAHCALASCERLDFLPKKCVYCNLKLCDKHFEWDKHDCAKAERVDRKATVCPICNVPVLVTNSENPNDEGEHRLLPSRCNVLGNSLCLICCVSFFPSFV